MGGCPNCGSGAYAASGCVICAYLPGRAIREAASGRDDGRRAHDPEGW